MLKLDTRIDLDLDKFLRWWGGELAYFVPKPLLKLLGGYRESLVLTRQGEGLAVALHSDGGVRPLGEFPLDDTGFDKRGQLFADDPELENAELVLRLTAAQALTKLFKLPAVAEENLHQVAAFELDRLTPFNAGMVYYDIKVTERLTATKQIRVELALAPRKVVDAVMDEVLASGWRPTRIDAESGQDAFKHNLLPDKFRPPVSRWPKTVTYGALALFCLLLLAVAGLPIVTNQRLIDELQAQVKAVGKVAKEVQELREDAEKLSNENGFLLQKNAENPSW